MRKLTLFIVLSIITLPVFAQINTLQIAPGAEGQLAALLNKPVMVKTAIAEPLGSNWFRLETDTHLFTDQVSVGQVAAILCDVEKFDKYFDGKRSKLTAKIAGQADGGTIVDYVSIIIAGPFKLNNPYRALNKVITSTNTVFSVEIKQLSQDTATNNKMKNLYATRYAEEVTINGKNYTYIRMYNITDTNASIIPGAKGILERNAGPTSEESLNMIFTAAKERTANLAAAPEQSVTSR